MREVKNKEQLLEFVQEHIEWLTSYKKDRQHFLRENLTEDEIKEYNVIIEGNE